MNTLRSVVSNTIVSLIGQVITWTSTLVLTIAYGRFLGDEKFGELYFAINLILLVGFPLEFGFNRQITRDVAQEPDKALPYLSNTLLIKFLIWLVTYGLLLLVCWSLRYSPEERTLVALCGLTLLSGAVANTCSAAHYALKGVVHPVVGNILEKGVSACAGVLLLRSGAGVEAMALVLLGGSLLNAAWQCGSLLRQIGTRVSVDLGTMRTLLLTSIPFLAYGVLGVIYYRLDTVLLSLMENVTVVGWYGAGYRLFDTLTFVPGLIISPIMLPVFAKLSAASELSLRAAVEKTMNLLLVTSIPIATILIVAAPGIISFLYHRAEFAHTIPALQALAPGVVLLYSNMLLTSILVSTKRESKIPVMAGIALAFNLLLNLILIPLYQQVGAAIVTSLTELLLFCIALAFVPRHLLPLGSVRVGAKALAASLVMAGAVLLMRQLSILAVLPLAALVYVAAGMLLGAVPKEDLRALHGALRVSS